MRTAALIVLAACAARPVSPVTGWLATHAVTLDHVEPGGRLDDMAPLAGMIGSARVVGLGEATHGTHEFFTLKHRLLEYAVTRLGFTVFGIEAGHVECRAIDDYITTGKGDPRAALGVTFPIWNVDEVVALIEWMRAWNADPAHPHKLRFVGFDAQTTFFAYREVAAFLTEVAPDQRAALVDPLAVLGQDIGGLTPADWDRLLAGLARLGAALEEHHAAWSAAAGEAAFTEARHDVTLMEQAARYYQSGDEDVRDRAMADNVGWLLDHEPAGTRMILWAHNGHVAVARADQVSMGAQLRRRFGADYVSVGFLFGQGSFRTVEVQSQRAVLVEHAVGPAPADHVTAPFVATRRNVVVADLRAARGAVAAYFAAEHPMREAGGTFSSEADLTTPVRLSARYDIVVFVDRMTGSHPLR